MKSVVGVLGASGGVGASTFAAVLAATGSGVLIDIDAAGGGIDVMLGVDDTSGARWSSVRVGGGRVDPGQLADGLVRWGATRVLAADVWPQPEAIAPVVDAAAQLGVVALDLGRSATPARQVACSICDVAVLVVASDPAGIAAARAAVRDAGIDRVALVVRRGPVPVEQVADVLGVPSVGVLPALGARSQSVLDEAHLPRTLVQVAAGIVDGLR